jgi:hypothetical protein
LLELPFEFHPDSPSEGVQKEKQSRADEMAESSEIPDIGIVLRNSLPYDV